MIKEAYNKTILFIQRHVDGDGPEHNRPYLVLEWLRQLRHVAPRRWAGFTQWYWRIVRAK